MKPDTTKLDALAATHAKALARLNEAQTEALAAKTAEQIAFAEFHGAAAEFAALHGGRAKAIREAAADRAAARAIADLDLGVKS